MVKIESSFNDYLYAYIFGIGAFLIILILIFAVGRPLYNDTVKNQAELKVKQQELAFLENRLDILKELDGKKAELMAQNQKVLSALPVDKDVARLFVQVENIASQNGISITSVSDNSGATTANSSGSGNTTVGIKRVTYKIDGQANSYQATKDAIAKIESALRVVSIPQIDINGANGKLTINFTVETYVRGS